MASIDNRVVSISFDNAAFQKNVEDTIRSLDALKGKLNFQSASNAFSDLNKASQTVNLSSIASAVDSISNKFSAMGAVAFSILDNLTTKALGVSQNLVSSFSFTPVVGGFQEYETNMNSIQTILANTSSKGTNLKDVNAALDELNNYSDQTIYNFSEMARNIGTFTAAGVDLKTSTESIKGIANLAAVSGSSSQQASVAMYQLSQAIASGTVRLIDWNSVQNAGMGGEVFQRALFETGKTLGTIADTPIDMTFEQWTAAGNTFRTSLEDNWLTSEVLTQTLQGFTGDLTEAQLLSMGYTQAQAAEIMKMGVIAQDAATKVKTLTQLVSTTKEVLGSGWAQSFRIIVGDFEEARELFTGINNVLGNFINESANARNQLLTDWKNLGGRTLLISGLTNVFKALVAVIKPIRDAFRTIFPKKTAEELFALTLRFNEFTKKLIIGGKTATAIKGIFLGIFSIFRLGIAIIKGVFSVFSRLIGLFTKATGGTILSFFGNIGNAISNFVDILLQEGRITGFFNSIFQSIQNFVKKINIQPVIDKLNQFKDAIFGFFKSDSSGGGSAAEGTVSKFQLIKTAIDRVSESGTEFGIALGNAFDKIRGFADAAKEKISEFWDNLKNVFSERNADRTLSFLGVGLFAGVLALIKGFIDNGLVGLLGGRDIVKALTNVFGEFGGVLNAFQTNIKAGTLLKIAYAIGILTISIIALSLIDPVKLAIALGTITAAVGILSGALAILTKIDFGLKETKQLLLLSISMGALSFAILALTIPLLVLSRIDLKRMGTALLGFTAILAGIIAVSRWFGKEAKSLISAGIGIGFIGAGMLILAVAMKVLSMIAWQDMVYGLGSVALAVSGLLGATRLMKSKADMVNIGAGFILIAGSLFLLAAAIKLFSMISLETMARGLGAIGATLATLGLALKLFPENDMIRLGITILTISVAMIFMAKAVKDMGSLSWETLFKAIVTFGAILLLLGVALEGLEKTGLTGGVTLFLIVYSLQKLTDVFRAMEGISLTAIAKGLFAIGGVLLLIGVAALAAQYLAPGFLALGATIFLIGAGFALAGVGVRAFAQAISILAEAGMEGLYLIIDNIDELLSVAPKVAKAVAKIFYAFVTSFLEGAPALLGVIGTIFEAILDLVIKLIPKLTVVVQKLLDSIITVTRDNYQEILDLGYEILLAFLSGIADNIEEIVTTVAAIITEFTDGLTASIPDLIESAVDFLVAWLGGITDNLDKLAPAVTELIVEFIEQLGESYEDIRIAGTEIIAQMIIGFGESTEDIVTAGFEALISFLEGISNNIQYAVDEGYRIITDLLNGIADSIEDNQKPLEDAGYRLLDAILKGITQNIWRLSTYFLLLPFKIAGWIGESLGISKIIDRGREIISGLWEGIEERIEGVRLWFSALGAWINTWLPNAKKILPAYGKAIIEGLWDGILSAKDWLVQKLKQIGGWIPGPIADVLGIRSPSLVMRELGVHIGEGLGLGIEDGRKYTEKAGENLASSLIDSFYVDENSLSDQSVRSFSKMLSKAIQDIDSIGEFNPTITPVLDLSGARRDLTAFNGLFTTAPVSPSLSYNRAQTISEAEAQRLIATSKETIGGGDINFNQTINAPTALSTNDIYRQTRSQIAMAKKELSLL